eukprot:g6124.t1
MSQAVDLRQVADDLSTSALLGLVPRGQARLNALHQQGNVPVGGATPGRSPEQVGSMGPVAGTGILELMKTKIAKLAKEKAALKADLLKNHGKIQDVTVEMAINGARAIKSMVTETSDLDANKGIAYRHLWPLDRWRHA